ncbi:phosphomannomutase/phosphoglucomutase [Methylophaga sp. OBS3]|uniref:phosphomannomutase/phosphoglucomutase n=1 Tax=Methylophaga sp. OBS3 TaxID=2991934 RepID=UPI002251AE10|nr:phosphomannomutase/phosphoglucomutase [Methylophaga sp. OBS3]MCX4190714.1 phosphomannomutase/phosphoglucomutase [Methylophaga sp. OBS3]
MANVDVKDVLKKRLNRPAFLLLVLVMLIAVTASFYLGQLFTPSPEDKTPERQQHIVSQQASALTSVINGWQKQAAEPETLVKWPEAKLLCIIETIPVQPQNGDCMPITYATLLALRQAQEQVVADVAVMQPNTKDAFVQLVRQHNNGYQLLALKPEVLSKLSQTLDTKLGYWTIQQGGSLVVAKSGDPELATMSSPVSSKIKGSHWQLSLWMMPPKGFQFSYVWWLPALLLALIVWWPLAGKLSKKQRATRQKKARKAAPVVVDTVEAKRHDNGGISREITDLETPVQDIQPTQQITATSSLDKIESHNIESDVEHTSAETMNAIVEEVLPEDAFDRPRSGSLDEKVETDTTSDVLEFYLPTDDEAVSEPSSLDPAIFKTYDIRGIVGSQLSESVMQQLGHAIGSEAQARGVQEVVVARDGRASSDSFAKSVIKGLNESGCDVLNIGAVPTPVLYFAAEHFETGSGLMITGSHNPADYNGVKIVLAGETLSGDAIKALHTRIEKKQLAHGHGASRTEDITDIYQASILAQIKLAKPLKVVVDCGNGIAGVIAPQLFKLIGCEVTPLFCDVDSAFPNHHPNPGQPENLQDLIHKVQEVNADLGLAFDGDGDRLGVVTGTGDIIWPDRLLMLFAQAILAASPDETILFDVKSTGLLHDTVKQAGGKPMMVASGHSLIKKALQDHNAKLAGELSGHIFFADRWYGFDDALYAACRLLELLAADAEGRSPSEIFAAQPQRVNTPEIHVAMDDSACREFMLRFINEAQFNDARITKIDGLRADFVNGWGLVRASNTVPGLTLRFEAGSEADLQNIKQLFVQQMLQVKPTLDLHL